MSTHASDVAECAPRGALTEAHAKLEPFEGTFAGQVKMWMGPGDPHLSTGVTINTLQLGGRFLHHTYQGDRTDGPFPNFQGCGYWGYNTTTRKYEGVWIDTASTAIQTETGEVDASGKVWTMIGTVTNPQTGQPMQKRSVITLQDSTHHRIEMFFQGPDGHEFRAMQINYTRKN